MRRSVLLSIAACALLLAPARASAQDIPEISVGEPILTGKEAEDPVKKSRTPAPPPRGNVTPSTYTEGKYFTVTVPLGWRKKNSSFAGTARVKKVYGSELFGPAGAHGVVSRITVFYYSPDNRLHKTSEDFINGFSKAPADPEEGAEYGKVKENEVAGRTAKMFDRIVFTVVRPKKGKPKKVPLYEYFAVVPAEAGYYALRFSAPKDIAKDNIKAFEEVLGSFSPLVK